MKIISILTVGACLFINVISACSKKTTDARSLYTGKWELRSTVGGLAPYKEYEPGNGTILEFTRDSVFGFTNHQRTYSYPYILRRDTTYYFAEPRVMDVLINADPLANSVSIFMGRKGDMLYQYIGIPAADGASASYEKIN